MREGPLDDRLLNALRVSAPSVWSRAVPRLAAELAARAPIVLVLDDFNLLHSRGVLETVGALIDDEAEGSMLVASARVAPKLRLAPLRAGGRLVEFGADDLALSKREAQMLLRATGVPLSEAQEAQLIEQCEGWPAALYLAALSIRDGEELSDGPAPLHGDDRYLADYFHTEYLDRLRPGPLRFLRRTSVLDRMSGPLCDAVLDDEGSGAQLAKIERANLFLDSARQPARVVPLPPPLPGAAPARARRARARARSGPPRPRRRLVRGGGRRRDRPRARPRSRRQRPSGRDPRGDRPPGLPVRPRREARGLVRALRQGAGCSNSTRRWPSTAAASTRFAATWSRPKPGSTPAPAGGIAAGYPTEAARSHPGSR